MQAIAGVDCHKDSHTIVFISNVGEKLTQLTIAATPAGYAQALAAAAAFESVIWGLEGTGLYGRGFADALLAAGYVVYEVPGAYAKRHRRHASRHGKSDVNDAQAIAEATLRERDRLPGFRSFDEQEALRLRHDQRDRLVRDRTQAINRLRSAALRLGLTPLPRDLNDAAAAKRMAALAEPLRGGSYAADALVDDVVFAAAAIEQCSAQIRQVEATLRPFVGRLAPELLELHGVAYVVAAGLIGHAGNLRNCRNADAFAMRCATAPVPCASGRSERVRLNHGGDRQLNRQLHQIAFRQVCSKAHPGRVYFERKLREGKTKRAALRALKRQLSTVVYFRLMAVQQRLEALHGALTAA